MASKAKKEKEPSIQKGSHTVHSVGPRDPKSNKPLRDYEGASADASAPAESDDE